MASSKRPTYKVETKLVTERKRRKSDLVIMWQSIWSVTVIIAEDLWLTLLKMWEFIQLWFSSSDRFLIQAWLGKYLPYVPEDFSESWRDGRLLAILLNKLQPGCFPGADRLDPDYGLKNVYRVFDALEIYFGIKPNVSVEEIVTCIDGSDAKLFEILLELKNLTDNQAGQQDRSVPEPKENTEQSGQWQSDREICIAKGTGLAVGFVGKITNFVIYCAVISDLDVVVEIKGPTSICSERITKRSPKRKRSVSTWECSRTLTRSVSFNDDNARLVTEEDNFEKSLIPLEYEVIGNQINLSYKPKEKGNHKVTILWHGQHVSDSPYFVTVEDPSDLDGINNIIHLKSALKMTSECGRNDVPEKSRKISVRFQESEQNCKKQNKQSGKILSRRVLRYIVKIQGKDIPVNAENTESLATELLKMDYDFEKCPSSHRRNSWGFAGDAERKKSVIRQFCVDVNELDAQISLRRTRSLSLYPGSKKLLQKSDSFESLASNLNMVSEDTFENNDKTHQNEEDYAYINLDGEETKQADEVKRDYEDEFQCRVKKGDTELSPEFTQCKFVESSQKSTNREVETNRISSLSTERVDNSDRDLQPQSPPSSPILKESHLDESNKKSFNYKCSSIEVDHDNTECRKNDSKHFHLSTNSKTTRKNHIKDIQNHPHSFKKRRLKRKFVNIPVQTFYKKVTRNKDSVSLPPKSLFLKRQENNKQMLKEKKNTSSKVSENFRIKDSITSKNVNCVCESYAENCCYGKQNIPQKNTTNAVRKKQCIKNTEKQEITKVSTYKNIVHEEAKTNIKESENMVQNHKVKKLDLNPNLNTILKALKPNTKLEIEDENICKTKPLQTHTLKPIEQFFINHSFSALPITCEKSDVNDETVERIRPLRTHTLKVIEQFNFKQFNPSFGSQSNMSPIKAQIGLWESTLSSVKQKNSSQNICASDTEQVSVKEKLAFWENACKFEQKPQQKKTSEDDKKTDLKPGKSLDFTRKDHSTGNKSNSISPISKEETETCNSMNKETNVASKKQTGDKISAELQLVSPKTKRRSFSDPVMLETAVDEVLAHFPHFESSKKTFSGSSTDDNFDSDDSVCDYILQSTEDEYIDDEISESVSEYWGDLSIVKDWRVSQCGNENPFLEEEFLQNCQRNKSYPEQCKVFGIAIYYGHVAVKNSFQVYTADAGFGNLSVSMQGFRRHDVSLVSVVYVRNDIYEVTYQVMTAGYYLISIRWMDKEIPGSPFVCKVTF